jgi:hypothetical protein
MAMASSWIGAEGDRRLKDGNSLLAGKMQGILFVWASEGGYWLGMQGQIQ